MITWDFQDTFNAVLEEMQVSEAEGVPDAHCAENRDRMISGLLLAAEASVAET